MRLSRIILFLLISALLSNTISSSTTREEISCESHSDCHPCFECSSTTQKCSPVLAYTDPHNDCTDICEIYTVCGENQHCILTSTPECDCDWISGECVKDPLSVEVVPIAIVSASEDTKQPNDIELSKNNIQNDNNNKDDHLHHHYYQESFYVYIGSVVILLAISFVIYAQYKNKQKNSRHHNSFLENTPNKENLQKNIMQTFLVVDSSSTNE